MSALSFCGGDISHHYGKVTVTDGCSGGVEDESIKLPHEWLSEPSYGSSGWDWWHREKISSQHHWIIVSLLLWLGLTIEQRKVSNIDRILDLSLAEQCAAKSCIEQQIQINVTIKLWLI